MPPPSYYVMKFIQPVGTITEESSMARAQVSKGSYLVAYDPDAYDGRGTATFTFDVGEAKQFHDAGGVLAEWRRISTLRPKRADGKPNRPLTVWTVMAEPVW